MMNTKKEKDHSPNLWYWYTPEDGLEWEDCEAIFREIIEPFRLREKHLRFYTSYKK